MYPVCTTCVNVTPLIRAANSVSEVSRLLFIPRLNQEGKEYISIYTQIFTNENDFMVLS